MESGKRYEEAEPKLNFKKVIAVIIAIAVIFMFVLAIKYLIKNDSTTGKMESASYFSVYTNGKWGVIDNNANIIVDPIYSEMIIIPDNKKDVFICTYDVDYENGTYKTKVINSKNQEILENYENVLPIENYDENNNLWYEKDVLTYEKDGKVGLINFKGKKILNAEYEKIYALKGKEKRLLIEKNGKIGLISTEGKVIIENNYKSILSIGKNTDNYIIETEEGKYGVADILECKYEEIVPIDSKEVFQVKTEGKYIVIDKEEKEVFKESFDKIKQVKDNIIIYKTGNIYKLYDLTNEKILDGEYEDATYASDKNIIVKKDNKYGVINTSGEEKLEKKYNSVIYYSEADIYEADEGKGTNIIFNNQFEEILLGVVSNIDETKGYIKLWTEEGYKYYNFRGQEEDIKKVLSESTIFLKKQDNKYGFVDKNDNNITEFIYDDATEQNPYGFAAVKKDGLWGAIDKDGKIVCEIKYNLDNNLIIDFIGEYYLGEDINLMYYTDK